MAGPLTLLSVQTSEHLLGCLKAMQGSWQTEGEDGLDGETAV
jgi:hypothetical protein